MLFDMSLMTSSLRFMALATPRTVRHNWWGARSPPRQKPVPPRCPPIWKTGIYCWNEKMSSRCPLKESVHPRLPPPRNSSPSYATAATLPQTPQNKFIRYHPFHLTLNTAVVYHSLADSFHPQSSMYMYDGLPNLNFKLFTKKKSGP